jgi:GT2 family glycosyltransferase
MTDLALGTKVFNRTAKLENLLASIDGTPVRKAYVADDGESSEEKQALYEKEYPFELEVLNLEYDAGLGRGRKRIVEELDEEYVLFVDTDHELPANVDVLIEQLDVRSDVGGIAGSVMEPERGRIWQSAKDFREDGDVLVRGANLQQKQIECIAGHPFIEFHFVPNATAFRTECLETYCWDPEYIIGWEHLDFYVGHWKQSEWTFGVCPAVLFGHYPGGSTDYTSNRQHPRKLARSRRYFLEKWGYDDRITTKPYWFDTHGDDPSFVERALAVYRNRGLRAVIWESLTSGPKLVRQALHSR